MTHSGPPLGFARRGTGLPACASSYEPDFLARLANDVTVALEIKGFEDDQDKAKHTAAKRWVTAVNNWGEFGNWVFHVCRNPQLLIRRWSTSAEARFLHLQIELG